MFKNTVSIARAGIIAGLYVVLSLVTFSISSGAVQLRASELLTILPIFYIEAIPALFIGCILSNFITGCAFLDVILGSIVTLVASILTYLIGKAFKNSALRIIFGGFFPVVLNAFLLPLIWIICYGVLEYVYYIQVLLLLAGQSLAVYLLGTPTYFAVKKLKSKHVRFF